MPWKKTCLRKKPTSGKQKRDMVEDREDKERGRERSQVLLTLFESLDPAIPEPSELKTELFRPRLKLRICYLAAVLWGMMILCASCPRDVSVLSSNNVSDLLWRNHPSPTFGPGGPVGFDPLPQLRIDP